MTVTAAVRPTTGSFLFLLRVANNNNTGQNMSLMDHKLTIPYPAYRHKDTVFVHRVHALEGEPPGGLKIEFNLS